MGFKWPHQVTFPRVLNWLQIMPPKFEKYFVVPRPRELRFFFNLLNFNRILKRSPNYHRSAPPILPRPLEESKVCESISWLSQNKYQESRNYSIKKLFPRCWSCRLGTETTKISFLGNICKAFGSAVVVIWRPLVRPNYFEFVMEFFPWILIFVVLKPRQPNLIFNRKYLNLC